ncbi:hypothetical protein [Chryseobacterium arthrosphaerae]|uniref:hypothetical protein n=1 Tax=Chryseobacterium arthrosphaerae TaxID=651561 RepID=UPI001E400E7F|nr:hypothetical protein [Chryseobacterium arthrosphaerae]UEQ75924.1 hypothetical protein J8N07_20140 [Chryseobacterium arthrosphaerae]
MQENLRKEFLPLVSKPGWIMTWLIRIFGIAILLLMFIILGVLPFLVCEKVAVLGMVVILYYPVWAVAMYRFFRFMKKGRKESVIKITVDDKGVHYDKLNGSRKEILYSQLGQSYLSNDYDVHLTEIRKTWVITLGVNGDTTKVLFNETDPGYSYYTKNSRALRARFIEGIVRFRPDLRIDPFVFEELSIHPEKFTFDRRQYLKHVGEAAILTGIILLISLGLMFAIVQF